MTTILKNYNPDKPNIVFGPAGSQKLLVGNSPFRDTISKNIYPISLWGKNSVDNSWSEYGNIYLANSYDGKLYKMNNNGEILSSLQFSVPSDISVIQGDVNSIDISGITNEYYGEEKGVFVIDIENNGAYKLDKSLNVEFVVGGVVNPIGISGPLDIYGFYVADDEYQKIIKFDRSGKHISYVDYSFFNPVISTTNKIVSIKQGWDGSLWVLTQASYLYNVSFNSREKPLLAKKININTYYSKYLPSGMDVDYFGQCVFLTMGVESEFVMLKYPNPNKEPLMIQYGPYYNMGYPYLLKVGQGKNSQSVFVLTGHQDEVDPNELWTTSSSISSESSIYPGSLFATSTTTTRLDKIDLNTFAKSFEGNHIVIGSLAITYDVQGDKLYYIPYGTSEIYSYDFSTKANTLIGDTGISGVNRICLSSDNLSIWMSKDSIFYIVSKANAGVLHTASIKTPQMADIASDGGMEINPYDGYLYITDGQAIYKINTADVANLTIIANKIVNKSVITSGTINDIAFGDDGTMFVIDYENLSTRIFQVKYLDANITYSLFKEYAGVYIEAVANGV